MDTVSSITDLRRIVYDVRSAGHRIGLVPTMGNLHAGHTGLAKLAREKTKFVVASIFVNPLQFGPDEDFPSYPRTPDADADLLATADVDLLFMPGIDDMYPAAAHNVTTVSVPDISGRLCGASRPGHFNGVATVVARLFNLVMPHAAVFGEKDFQQLLIIRRMVADLAFNIEIVSMPTVRELDGLAMSSRNRYLDPGQRAVAPLLYQVLNDAAGEVAAGKTDFRALEREAVERLANAGFEPEYCSICRQQDLVEARNSADSLRVLAAARLGKARLIDNIGIPTG